MSDFGTYLGLAILVLALCFGCSHCDREHVELEILRKKLHQEETK